MKQSSHLLKAVAFGIITLGLTLTACDRSSQQAGTSGQDDTSITDSGMSQQPGAAASPAQDSMSGSAGSDVNGQSAGSMGSSDPSSNTGASPGMRDQSAGSMGSSGSDASSGSSQ